MPKEKWDSLPIQEQRFLYDNQVTGLIVELAWHFSLSRYLYHNLLQIFGQFL